MKSVGAAFCVGVAVGAGDGESVGDSVSLDDGDGVGEVKIGGVKRVKENWFKESVKYLSLS